MILITHLHDLTASYLVKEQSTGGNVTTLVLMMWLKGSILCMDSTAHWRGTMIPRARKPPLTIDNPECTVFLIYKKILNITAVFELL